MAIADSVLWLLMQINLSLVVSGHNQVYTCISGHNRLTDFHGLRRPWLSPTQPLLERKGSAANSLRIELPFSYSFHLHSFHSF
jgi:hypothetical protein